MVAMLFDRTVAWAAWACRPALVLFPLLVVTEILGLTPTEVTIPFAAMAAIHAAGRGTWLQASRNGSFRFRAVPQASLKPARLVVRG